MHFKGFLLSYIRYGDYDAILHCFTYNEGFKSFFVKGIYSRKNKKKSCLFPLNELEISINYPKDSNILNVSNIELLQSFYDEKKIKSITMLMFSSDFLYHILKNENRNSDIYNEIQLFLKRISDNNLLSHICLVFNMLRYNGLLPVSAFGDFLDPETGRFADSEVHHLFDRENSLVWKKFASEKNNYDFSLSRTERNRFLESLMVYYKIHFTDFRIPNSMVILQQVFE